MSKIDFIEKLHDIAKKDENRTAIVYDNGINRLSYDELDRMSSAIADKVSSLGIGPGDAVMVMLHRDAISIAAEIGVLKAGAVFVPVVPSYPKERVDFIRNDCAAKLMIDEEFYEELPFNHSTDVTTDISTDIATDITTDIAPDVTTDITASTLTDTSENESDFEPVPPLSERVMIVYTSGSTGHPKGVVYDLAAYNMTVYRLKTHFEEIPIVNLGSFAPMAFVAHLFEFASVFDVGGTTHIISDDVRMDPIKLEQYYRNHRISVGFVSPKLIGLFKKELPDLKRVILGGEKICDFNPGKMDVIVSYAQTEAMDILRYRIDAPRKEAFIGTPVAGTKVFLLDEKGRDVGIMHEGEICAKGVYPSCYLNLPEETKKTFEKTDDKEVLVHTGDIGIRHENGLIQYVNRRDFMVKINGNKVDPSEIESAMKHIDGVDDAIIKAFDQKDGHVKLCCYFVSKEPVEIQDLKQLLGTTLPYYMIPNYFVRMDQIPRNPNGKPDRSALSEPDWTQSVKEYIEPANDDEKKVCGIVERLLHVEKVGMNDSFFELGADSLQAALLVSNLEREGMGIIEVKQVYEHPILSELMNCILDSALVGNADYTILSKGKSGNIPMIFYHTANMGCEAYRSLSNVLSPDIPFVCFENHNLNYPDLPIKSVESLIKYYQLMGSTCFEMFNWKETDTKILGGWSFGGVLAFEAAKNAEREGENITGLILMDPFLVEKKNRNAVFKAAADPNLKKYFEEDSFFDDAKNKYDVGDLYENNKLVAKMLSEYEPSEKLQCDVLFIKANVVRDTDYVKSLCYDYPANGFEKYCENIRIVSVNCNHDELGNNEETLRIISEYVMEKIK